MNNHANLKNETRETLLVIKNTTRDDELYKAAIAELIRRG